MSRRLLYRLLWFVPTLLGMSLVCFLIMQLSPGEAFSELGMDPVVSDTTIAALRFQYGLEQPVWQQYLNWLYQVVHGELGNSISYNMPVWIVISSRMGNTLLLALVSTLLAWSLALPLGIYAARYSFRLSAQAVTTLSGIVGAIPSFVWALGFLFIAVRLSLPLSIGGATSVDYAWLAWPARIWDRMQHLLIPAAALGLVQAARLIRFIRATMLDALQQDYITTARGKGVPETWVIRRHACRNAANPWITILGMEMGGLLSGAAVTEAVTGWPGLGLLLLDAVNTHDSQLVLGGLITGGAMLVVGNLLADTVLAIVDPRATCD